jgi:cephalosporin hydroxylase
MSDWIENITSAWKGHRKFAEWLVNNTNSNIIVELGVDYGYSTFVFANASKNLNNTIYGIDLFIGDAQTSIRNTYSLVINNIKMHNITNIEIIMGEFTSISKIWTIPINILHIDGFHTYEAVKNDFECWSKYVTDDGIILFHDTAVQDYGVKYLFRELNNGYKLYFTHSAGLGIYTKNKLLYELIKNTFDNVYDFNLNPF